MIRRVFTALLMMTAFLAVNGQDGGQNLSLIRARYLVSEKLYSDALTAIEGSTSDPNRTALVKGEALSGLARFDESNSSLERVTADCAAEAAYCQARNYMGLNDFSSAIQSLRKHLSDKNHYPEKQIRMDAAFSRLENDRDWVRLWQTDWYSEVEQQAAEGDYLIKQGQADDAGILAQKILSVDGNSVHGLFLQARVLLLEKEERQSSQFLDKAWSNAGNEMLLRSEILSFAVESGFLEKANAMASEMIRKDPSNPDYLITRSLVRIIGGKESQAQKEIETTEAAGIAPAELYFQAGRRMAVRMPREAEAYLNKAVETGNMDARYYHSRATIRTRLENFDQAMDDFAMSLDINPNQPDLYMERARVRLDRGDNDGACHDWQRALEMGTKDAADLLYKYCKLP